MDSIIDISEACLSHRRQQETPAAHAEESILF